MDKLRFGFFLFAFHPCCPLTYFVVVWGSLCSCLFSYDPFGSANWDQLTDAEKETTWRRISKRNEERRKILLAQQEQEQLQQESSSKDDGV
jgi:hypothetical protein